MSYPRHAHDWGARCHERPCRESTSEPSPTGWSRTSTVPSDPFTFDVIAGGHSNLTFRVTGSDGSRIRAAPPAARPRAGERPRHGPRAPHPVGPAGLRRAGPAGQGLLRRPRRQRRAVLRHGVRRRPRAPRPRHVRGARSPTRPPGATPAGRSSTRWPPSTPSTSTRSGWPTSAATRATSNAS